MMSTTTMMTDSLLSFCCADIDCDVVDCDVVDVVVVFVDVVMLLFFSIVIETSFAHCLNYQDVKIQTVCNRD